MRSAVDFGYVGAPPRRSASTTFTELEFSGLPEPVCRYFAAAVKPGTPLDGTVRLDVEGRIRRRRLWAHFRAHYVITRQLDFVGVGTAGELVAGFERYVAGAAEQRARLAGVVAVHNRDGADLSRGAAGRAGLGAVLLPTALLPRFGVAWTVCGDDQIRAAFQVNGVPVVLRLRIDDDGRLLAADVNRWGDPEGTGVRGWHPFGAVFTAEAFSGGLTIPAAGRAGWYMGTDRWGDGEVLRFEIPAIRPGRREGSSLHVQTGGRPADS